ncbi:peptidoglycan recognition protein family protein [Oceanobacillus timonensis]|uniref:peptidoglycan recognition protein family protein n=1 Tax=Oceanobacillus timonensis TaxID=1926285 RepID=UPI0009B98C01|nr:N-acetylmuramoyl-L-alanine amidase [Oceanobacillus timonensis]
MVKIKNQLIHSTPNSHGQNNKKRYITVHETDNPDKGVGAQTHANLQSNGNSRSANWHWQVDDKIAIKSFDHRFSLWAAGDGSGDGNLNSIHVEICVNSDSNYKKACENAAELVKKIMNDEGISPSNVVQHHHWSGKHCPRKMRDGNAGVTWNQFKNMISDASGNTDGGSNSSGTTWTKVTGNWTGQTLGNGEYGTPVKQLQTKLANNQPPFYPNKGADNNGIDSYYGNNTEDAVSRFQSYYGLNVDGLAGKQVYNKLNESNSQNAKKGSSKSFSGLPDAVYRARKPYPSGSGVRAVQEALASKYYYPNKGAKNNGIDGVYGPNTANAVKRYQSMHGLTVDGVYGPKTKASLEK